MRNIAGANLMFAHNPNGAARPNPVGANHRVRPRVTVEKRHLVVGANSAFTIAELLVSMAILAVLGLAMTTIMRSGLTAWRQGQKRTDTDATAQLVMDQIADDFGSIFTKSIQPPGPVSIEIATLRELQERGTVFFSNEWCTFSDEIHATSYAGRFLYADTDDTTCTFHFRLRFTTHKARIWIAASGASSVPPRLKFEAKIVTPQNEGNDLDWHPQDDWPGGELSPIIPADGADHIAIRAVFYVDEGLDVDPSIKWTHPSQPRLLPGDEGPVLRFTAEPDPATIGRVQFMLVQPPGQPGEPQKAVFVRTFSRRSDTFGLPATMDHGSLGEVCYLTTFDEEPPGTRSLTGTLWRAVRKPLGNWLDNNGQLPAVSSPGTSFFERDFIGLGGAGGISVLGSPVIDEATSLPKRFVYSREQNGKMDASGFYPIAENVLYFGIEAWDDSLDSQAIPGWTDDWDPARGVPSKVRVILVLQNQESRPTIARLKGSLDGETTTTRIELDGATDFEFFSANSPAQRYVKIDNEWIYYDNVGYYKKDEEGDSVLEDAHSLVFDAAAHAYPEETDRPRNGLNRGQRGTAGSRHEAGADVHQGETYVRVIPLPYPKLIPQMQPQGQEASDYREERY